MQLKTLMVSVLFVMCGAVATAQADAKKSIEKDFNKFLGFYTGKEFSKAMDYIVPEFFESYPKDKLVTVLEQSMNNPDMQVSVTNAKITNIEEPVKVGEKYYALITYGIQLNLEMKAREKETPEKKKLRVNSIKDAFSDVYGKGKVNYNESTGFFEIQQEKHAYAISENKTQWKFLEVDDKDSQEIYKKILPADAYEKIKQETPAK